VQALATQVGSNTVINFGSGNTLTLNNVTKTNLTANDFVFTAHITGDLGLTVAKGDFVPVSQDDYSVVVMTTNDFHAVYPGTPADQLTFTVSQPTHGWVALLGTPATPITSFTEAELEAGVVTFVHDGSDTSQATFQVSVSNGVDPATPPTTIIATVPTYTLTAQSGTGVDFMNDNTIESIGSGVVQGGGTSSTFTIVNANPAVNRDFVFEGAGFVYGAGNAITGGTIFAFQVLTHDTQTLLADFSGRVGAAEFYSGAVAAAAGDQSSFNALTAQWTSTSTGAAGDDSFGAGDNNDFFKASGGFDTFNGGFGFDRANYTGLEGPIDVQLAVGIVTKYAVPTKAGIIGIDLLHSVEHVTGTDFRDTFNAIGFSASSPNAGSTVTFNTAGTRNEFEGRGGDDIITGNGNTRVSYLHATAGVTVTFSSWVSGQSASGTAVGNASVGTDTFTGVNAVRGSYFDDVFTGSNNDPNTAEFFEGRGGNDLINGGGGFDKAIYLFEDTGIAVHLASGQVVGGFNTGTDTLLSVEAVIGTDFADTYDATGFSGSSTNAGSNGSFNEFEGAGGNDVITGNGNTRVAFYDATGGVTVTLGTNGSGTSSGTEPGDLADVGNDTFNSGVKDVRGSEFGDIITGNGGNNVLEGQGGNDVVNGRGGNDTLTGGTGSDIFVYGTNVFNGNNPPSNNDAITDFNPNEGDRIDLRGIAGITDFSDVLAQVQGGSPNTIQIDAIDSLTLNVPVATLQDSDFIFNGQVAITVQTSDGYNFGTLYDDMAGSIGAIDAVNGSHFTATNSTRELVFDVTVSNDAIAGNPLTGTVNAIDIYDLAGHILANTNGWNFLASDLNNALQAYAGDHSQTAGLDAIFANVSYSAVGNFVGNNEFNNNSVNFGGDTFVSGAGNDVFNGLTNPNGDYNNGDTVDYSHASGPVTIDLSNAGPQSALNDTLINIENLRGSAFDDHLTGDNSLAGNVLEGGAGNDVLDGSGGGGGFDTVSYEHATGGVTVNLGSGTADGASVGHDTISNFKIVRGSAYADILTGNNDSILEGGPGGDQLVGNVTANNASVTASYEHATAGVTVNLLNTDPGSNTGDAAGDTFVFVSTAPGQHFNLQGSQFNDTLIGDDNDNVLNGGGNHGGGDILTGHGGADTFVFSGGHVTITDFSHSDGDLIDLSFLNFGVGIADTDLPAILAAAPDAHTLNLGDGQVLTISNVNVSTLQSGDFILHL
jgi:Ca2+-binding RTX toxin-like protein